MTEKYGLPSDLNSISLTYVPQSLPGQQFGWVKHIEIMDLDYAWLIGAPNGGEGAGVLIIQLEPLLWIAGSQLIKQYAHIIGCTAHFQNKLCNLDLFNF